MHTNIRKNVHWVLVLALALVLTSANGTGRVQPAAAQMPMAPAEGIVCTDGPDFALTTKTGYIGTPDDNIIFMWGFSAGNTPFQHPGPVLCVNQGDTVTVILRNTLSEPVSIVFPGQEEVLANGAPVQPQFDGSGALTSLAQTAAPNGGSVTYSFVANHPGTFLYQSGTNPVVQVRMGLFGALIVRPTTVGPNGGMLANERMDSEFNPNTEFLVLLSEIDPYLNQAVERGQSFDMANYHPRYWLINGRGFPDSMAPNYASWLPNQPYGALARVEPFQDDPNLPDYNPLWSLTRFISVGTVDLPMHPHSKSALIIGRDGRTLEGPLGEDLAYENFSVPMGPGQTWDGLFRWYDPDGYDRATNPVTVDVPGFVDVVYGMLYSGSPYLGEYGPFPVDFTPMNECGEYYVISHVHALHKITSWGAPMTGPITFLRIDPPGGCSAAP